MRIMSNAIAFILFACSVSSAQQGVRFPVNPTPVSPAPSPVSKLTANTLYIIDSDVPLIVLASPSHLVSVTEDAGPMKVKAWFVDGKGMESRTFKGKHLFFVEALASGTVELIIVPVGVQKSSDVIRKSLEVDAGKGPQPPPKPDDPTPQPAGDGPFAGAAGLHVLIVYESGKNLSIPHHSIIYGKAFRDYLAEKCAKVNGTPQRRIYDKDIDTAGESKLWQDAMKRPRQSIPWICVGNGANWFEGPLPASEADAMALLRKYGG